MLRVRYRLCFSVHLFRERQLAYTHLFYTCILFSDVCLSSSSTIVGRLSLVPPSNNSLTYPYPPTPYTYLHTHIYVLLSNFSSSSSPSYK